MPPRTAESRYRVEVFGQRHLGLPQSQAERNQRVGNNIWRHWSETLRTSSLSGFGTITSAWDGVRTASCKLAVPEGGWRLCLGLVVQCCTSTRLKIQAADKVLPKISLEIHGRLQFGKKQANVVDKTGQSCGVFGRASENLGETSQDSGSQLFDSLVVNGRISQLHPPFYLG